MNTLAFFSNLGGPDLIILLLIILVLFGAKKLPELAKGMGQAMKEFQKAKDDVLDPQANETNHPRDARDTAAAQLPPQLPPTTPAPASTNQVRPEDKTAAS